MKATCAAFAAGRSPYRFAGDNIRPAVTFRLHLPLRRLLYVYFSQIVTCVC